MREVSKGGHPHTLNPKPRRPFPKQRSQEQAAASSSPGVLAGFLPEKLVRLGPLTPQTTPHKRRGKIGPRVPRRLLRRPAGLQRRLAGSAARQGTHACWSYSPIGLSHLLPPSEKSQLGFTVDTRLDTQVPLFYMMHI